METPLWELKNILDGLGISGDYVFIPDFKFIINDTIFLGDKESYSINKWHLTESLYKDIIMCTGYIFGGI